MCASACVCVCACVCVWGGGGVSWDLLRHLAVLISVALSSLGAVANYRHFFFQTNDVRMGGMGSEPVRLEEKSALNFFFGLGSIARSSPAAGAGRANATRGRG